MLEEYACGINIYNTYGHWLDRLPIKKKDTALKIMKLFSHECVCLLCLNIFNDTFTTQEDLHQTLHILNDLSSYPFNKYKIVI